MARAVRVQYEGAWYLVMARGNRKEAIFLDDGDREAFLTTLGQACAMTGWKVVGSGLQKIAACTYCSVPEVRERHENAASELLERGLSTVGTTESEIFHWSRSEPRKVVLAALLRRHTIVSNQWIADRLKLGSAANVSQRVRAADLSRIFRQLPETQKKTRRRFFDYDA